MGQITTAADSKITYMGLMQSIKVNISNVFFCCIGTLQPFVLSWLHFLYGNSLSVTQNNMIMSH